MALLHSFEKSGQYLFKYRGQIPILIFLIGIPFLYTEDYTWFSDSVYAECLLTAIGIFISCLGIIIRAYTVGTTPKGTSGRNTEKQIAEELNTSGIYSIVRHPLYVGNYLMWAGLLIFAGNIAYFLIASLIYWLYYERIMFTEERFLEKKFGTTYLDWSLTVPAFIPALTKFKRGNLSFSLKEVLKREYSGIFAMSLCFMIVDLFRYYLIHQTICYCRPSIYITLFFFVAMLILRTLKHHSKLLDSRN